MHEHDTNGYVIILCIQTSFFFSACVTTLGGWGRGAPAVTYWYFSWVAFAGERLESIG